LSTRGWLPIAACGRRGTTMYFLNTRSEQLELWQVNDGSMQPLGLGLAAALGSATPAPEARVRQRLLRKRAFVRRLTGLRKATGGCVRLCMPQGLQLAASALAEQPTPIQRPLKRRTSSRSAPSEQAKNALTPRCSLTLSLF